jgi:hypothetical protein
MTIKEFLSMFNDISAVDVIITNGAYPHKWEDEICVAGGDVQFLNGELVSTASDETYSVEEILEEAPEEYKWMMSNNRNVWTRQMVVSRLNSILLDMEVLNESVKFDKHELKIGISEEDYAKLYGAIGMMYFD